jgi:hypothetical protein
LYDESYDLDHLSFFEIETIVKKFGYQVGDLVYYREPGKELDDGLVLLTSDKDVLKIAEVYLGHKLVILYMMSFANDGDEVVPNVGEDEDSGDEERRRKVINDPYWQSLMSDDDDAWDAGDEPMAGTSTCGDETSTFGDVWHDFIDFDEEAGDENDGDGSDDEGGHEEAAEPETTHVGGLRDPASLGGRLLDDEEEDKVSSNLARSDILVTRPKSDEEYKVNSRAKCVTRTSQFKDVDMEDPHLDVGMSFDSATQFRKALREYNLFRGKDVKFTKNDGDQVIGLSRSRA